MVVDFDGKSIVSSRLQPLPCIPFQLNFLHKQVSPSLSLSLVRALSIPPKAQTLNLEPLSLVRPSKHSRGTLSPACLHLPQVPLRDIRSRVLVVRAPPLPSPEASL